MKKIYVPDGTYIVAVSGGVDSMTLLHMLQKRRNTRFIVAHVNHGLRPDAHLDQELVAAIASRYGFMFETINAKLQPSANEAVARDARYVFLHNCRTKHDAHAIITAHHQDDLIETVILNIMRGTGWRGLAPFTHSKMALRPLLKWSKHELIGYARRHNLQWREDTTNTDERFTRNYIRHTIIPTLDQRSISWQNDLLRIIRNQQNIRIRIEQNPIMLQNKNATSLQRYNLITQHPLVARDLLRATVSSVGEFTLTLPQTEKALHFAKVAAVGKYHTLNATWRLRATKREVIVEPYPLVVS